MPGFNWVIVKEFEKAVPFFTRALDIDPDNEVYHNNIGNVFKAQGILPEAKKHFSVSLRLNPLQAVIHNDLGKVLVDLYGLGEIYSRFFRNLEKYRGNYPADVVPLQDKIEEVSGHFSRAVELNPGFADAHNNLGAVLVCLGRFDQAVLSFQEALRVKPDFVLARQNLEKVMKK